MRKEWGKRRVDSCREPQRRAMPDATGPQPLSMAFKYDFYNIFPYATGDINYITGPQLGKLIDACR